MLSIARRHDLWVGNVRYTGRSEPGCHILPPQARRRRSKFSPRQQLGPSGGSLCFLKGFLSHLITLSLLRHNLLPLMLVVMLGHSNVISACNTTISAMYSRSNKTVTL